MLDGASNGCAFYKDALRSLESILSAYGYQYGSASPNFQPRNWIYELFFSDSTGYLELATGQWICAKGEIVGDKQKPQQEQVSYCVLANPGTLVKGHFPA